MQKCPHDYITWNSCQSNDAVGVHSCLLKPVPCLHIRELAVGLLLVVLFAHKCFLFPGADAWDGDECCCAPTSSSCCIPASRHLDIMLAGSCNIKNSAVEMVLKGMFAGNDQSKTLRPIHFRWQNSTWGFGCPSWAFLLVRFYFFCFFREMHYAEKLWAHTAI